MRVLGKRQFNAQFILDAIIIHVRYTGKEMGADDFKADRIFIPNQPEQSTLGISCC